MGILEKKILVRQKYKSFKKFRNRLKFSNLFKIGAYMITYLNSGHCLALYSLVEYRKFIYCRLVISCRQSTIDDNMP